jgi:DNA-binding IclR family transcriptional regulator
LVFTSRRGVCPEICMILYSLSNDNSGDTQTMARQGSGASSPENEKSVIYSAPALEKGLDVIELLAHQPAGLTKSQIARRLNRTVSEIFRMLLCLEHRGYIAQISEDRYSLTLKLFKLVQEHPPTERLIADALPVMHRLAHETLQSCHLGVVESDRVAILAQVNAPANIGFYVKLGSTVDLMEAASGYVILSHLGDAQRERVLAEWSRATNKKLPRDLDLHLSRIRKAGYEKRASYLVKGVLNISFPILDERESAVGALTVPYIQYMEPAKNVDQIIQSIRKATAEISAAIGG